MTLRISAEEELSALIRSRMAQACYSPKHKIYNERVIDHPICPKYHRPQVD